MKSEEFIDIIGDIEEEYLLKAHEERKIKKVIPMKKVFALTAVLIILGATAIAVVASGMEAEYKQSYDVSLINGFGREMEGKGYTIELDLLPVSIESLNIKPDEDDRPWETECFYRTSEAVDYIGCEKIETPDLGLHCGVNWVVIEKEDHINPNYAVITSNHQGDGIKFTTKTHIIIGEETGKSVVYEDSFEAGGLNGKDIVYTSEYFTNANGINYLVVKSSVVEDYHVEIYGKDEFEKVIYINAYLVKNGIAYTFSAEEKTVYHESDPEITKLYEEKIYKPENNAKIEKYLKLWADSF